MTILEKLPTFWTQPWNFQPRPSIALSRERDAKRKNRLWDRRAWCRAKKKKSKRDEGWRGSCGEVNAIPSTKGCIKPRQRDVNTSAETRASILKARVLRLTRIRRSMPAPNHLRAMNRIRLLMHREYIPSHCRLIINSRPPPSDEEHRIPLTSSLRDA